jgi:hypothetical protein
MIKRFKIFISALKEKITSPIITIVAVVIGIYIYDKIVAPMIDKTIEQQQTKSLIIKIWGCEFFLSLLLIVTIYLIFR